MRALRGDKNRDFTETVRRDDATGQVIAAFLAHPSGLTSFSNYGAATVDLAAPCQDIFSTTPFDNFAS